MENSQFDLLLKDLEEFFKCPLSSSGKNACLVKMGIGIAVQIEMNEKGELIIGCCIGTIPPGKYRDNLIRSALKSNESSLPSVGSFGYSTKTNHLILFEVFPEGKLNKDDILPLLPPLIEKAKEWTEAVNKGEIPYVPASGSGKSGGVFGLI